ncbi:hypothetical protein [Methylobacterium sp. GC_Met_2]|uniref:hypothetical protein n=1 Tax=Methylobacterium sp. GC_Met_2 TaxID=2937376 RepID=UPI00226B41C0|nr:hypothetical protein [Methylobacterium sp. GC_Met_2]
MADDDHEREMVAHVVLSRALDDAWAAALIVAGGCTSCAEKELAQHVGGRAYETRQWIMGEQPMHEPSIIPRQREGVRMFCAECRP